MRPKRKTKRSDLRIAERWTERLAATGFTPIVSAFLQNYATLNPPITVPEAMLIIHLVSYKWSAKAPHPAVKTIAALMGCSERYIRKLLQGLETAKYITRIERKGASNEFDLSGLFQALEAKIPIEIAKPTVFDAAAVDVIAELRAKLERLEASARIGTATSAPPPLAVVR